MAGGARPTHEVFISHKNPDGSFGELEKVGAMWEFKSGKPGWNLKLGDDFFMVLPRREKNSSKTSNPSRTYVKPQPKQEEEPPF
jgi:hypothetical protein